MSVGRGEVRIATSDDAAAVAELIVAFNTEFGVPGPSKRALESNLLRLSDTDRFFAMIGGEPPSAIVTVALKDTAYAAGPVLSVEDFYVRPEARNRGLGSDLMSALVRYAVSSGASMIDVPVDEGDTDAMRFYERHGFVHRDPDTGERAFYIFKGVTAAPRSD